MYNVHQGPYSKKIQLLKYGLSGSLLEKVLTEFAKKDLSNKLIMWLALIDLHIYEVLSDVDLVP